MVFLLVRKELHPLSEGGTGSGGLCAGGFGSVLLQLPRVFPSLSLGLSLFFVLGECLTLRCLTLALN